MPKVLVIAEFAAFGGTRSYFKKLVELYREYDWEIVVALTEDQLDVSTLELLKNLECRYRLIPRRPTMCAHAWYRFPFSGLFDLYCYMPLRLTERPDLTVVSNGTPGLFLFVAAMTRRLLYVAHTYPESKSRWRWLQKMREKLLRSLFNSSGKKIVTVSTFSANRIQDAWLGTSTRQGFISVIPNCGSIEAADQQGAIINHAPDIVVLTLGHVDHHKNPFGWLRVALDTIHRAKGEVRFLFIWVGAGSLLHQCRRRVDEIMMGESIKFLGYREDVLSLYRSADIYFQPSIVESQGIAVIDAMCAGLPTVVSDAGGLPESVVDGETGFVVSISDEAMMVRSLLSLGRDQFLRRRMSDCAKSVYKRRFSTSIWVDQMTSVHRKIGVPLFRERMAQNGPC